MITAKEALKIKSIDSNEIIDYLESEIIRIRREGKYVLLLNYRKFNMDDSNKKNCYEGANRCWISGILNTT